jgi:hypothetical protein
MLATLDFIRTNAALISLGLLIYCAWRMRQIERRTEAIKFMLFRDYDYEMAGHGVPTISKN